ncbi:hypothetical protein DIPPA_14692 [Diplonema papillatum]|nr:hypothetical protein DIPPA_14692 [Diplonema papillatum]
MGCRGSKDVAGSDGSASDRDDERTCKRGRQRRRSTPPPPCCIAIDVSPTGGAASLRKPQSPLQDNTEDSPSPRPAPAGLEAPISFGIPGVHGAIYSAPASLPESLDGSDARYPSGNDCESDVVELEVSDQTPPLSLVAVVAAFGDDLSVQSAALKYLSMAAFEHQETLSREDILQQVLYAASHAVESQQAQPEEASAEVAIDVCSSPPASPQQQQQQQQKANSPSTTTNSNATASTTHTRGGRRAAADVVSYAFRACAALALGHPRNQLLLLRGGVAAVLWRAIDAFGGPAPPPVVGVVVDCVHLLAVLVAHPVARVQTAAGGGADRLLETLRAHAGSALIQQDGARVLSQLSSTTDARVADAIDWSLSAQVLKNAKQNHPGNATVVSVVAQAMISVHSGFRLHAQRHGATPQQISEFCSAMAHFESTPSVHSNFMSLLHDVSHDQPLAVLDGGGIDTVLRAMLGESPSAHTFKTGATIIDHVAAATTDERRVEFLDRFCCEALLTAIRYHPGVEEVNGPALLAFTRFATTPGFPAIFTGSGGIPTLLDAIGHSASADVHAACARILAKLCGHPPARAEMLERRAAVAVGASLKRFPFGFDTSRLLLELSAEARAHSVLGLVIPAIVYAGNQALGAQNTSESSALEVHRLLLGILRRVTVLEANQEISYNQSVVQYTLDALWAHKRSPAVVEQGLHVVVNVCLHPSCAKHIRHHRGIAFLDYASRHHPDLADVCKLASTRLDIPG